MSGENVARLPVMKDEGKEPAPALGMSLQVDLGMGRVATLQTFVPSDAPLPLLNMMLDKMTRAGDRQRAHYKMEELHRDLLEEERKHAQMQEDVETARNAFNAEQEKRIAEIEKRERILVEFDAGIRAKRGEGRRNETEPKGADKANVEKMQNHVKDARQAIVEADLAYQTDCANRAASMKTHEKAIERIKREIERCKEIEAAGLKE